MDNGNFLIKILEHLNKVFGYGQHIDIEEFHDSDNSTIIHKNSIEYKNIIKELSNEGFIETNRNNLYYLQSEQSLSNQSSGGQFPISEYYSHRLKAKITIKGVLFLLATKKDLLQTSKLEKDLESQQKQLNFWKSSTRRNRMQIYALFVVNILFILFKVLIHYELIK